MTHRPPAVSLPPDHLPSLRAALRWPLVLAAVFLALLTCGGAVTAAPRTMAGPPAAAAIETPDLEAVQADVHRALSRAIGAVEALIPAGPAGDSSTDEEDPLGGAWSLIAGADHEARAVLSSARLSGSAPAKAVDRALRLVYRETARAQGLLRTWERSASQPADVVRGALQRVRVESARALAVLRGARRALRARGLKPAVPDARASRSPWREGDDKVRMAGSSCPRVPGRAD